MKSFKENWLLYVAAIPLTMVIVGLGAVSTVALAKTIIKGK